MRWRRIENENMPATSPQYSEVARVTWSQTRGLKHGGRALWGDGVRRGHAHELGASADENVVRDTVETHEHDGEIEAIFPEADAVKVEGLQDFISRRALRFLLVVIAVKLGTFKLVDTETLEGISDERDVLEP